MASEEIFSSTLPTESKAMKRKHESTESPENTEIDAKKRLSKFSLKGTYSLKTKELKQKAYVLTPCFPKKSEDSSRLSDDDSGDEGRKPTAEELAESRKPKNMLSIITIRQKKRQRHEKNVNSKGERNSSKSIQRITDYLKNWKHSHSEWKFQKLRQMYLIEFLYDEDKINEDLWPIALEYIASIQGSAKEKIKEEAEKIIEKIDADIQTTGDNTLVNQISYRRAREVLQNVE